MEKEYYNYTDFLKDKSFIQWQLSPNKQSNKYWKDFFQQHPQLNDACQLAIVSLKGQVLNKSELTSVEKEYLLQKIQYSISKKSKNKILLRYAKYAAVACVLLSVSMTGYNLYFNESLPIDTGEIIIGNLFESENIQLFTKNKALSLHDNMHLKIDEKGEGAIIQSVTQVGKSVDMSSGVLNKLVIPYGKRMQLSLSDGTNIWLNSGTVLEFPSQFASNEREIYLKSGEIYVEVAKDQNKSFYVHTSDFNVKVYGTKFNLSSYSNRPHSVVLVEGLVSLQSDNVKEQFISPNEQAVYAENGAFSVAKVDTEKYTSWKDGYLVFNKTPMTEVLSQIERYYSLAFNYYRDINIQKRTCTGKIYLSEDLDNVMITIGLLTSTKYKREKNQIYIMNESD